MTGWLCVEVRFLHGRYHGRGDWPPTPLRLFQAVVAGALSGRWAVEDRAATETALRWWENLGAPSLVLAPKGTRPLKPYRLAVPNNQADRHIAALKKGAQFDKLLAGDKELKHVTPRYVGKQPLIYAWELPDAECEHAEALPPIVRRLTALGHGIDHAIADAAVIKSPPSRTGLISFPASASPCTGTLESLDRRHGASLSRLADGGLNEALPPIRSAPGAALQSPDIPLLFTLRQSDGDGFAPVEPLRTALLAHAVRSCLAERLRDAADTANRRAAARSAATRATFDPEDIDRFVVGRSATLEDAARRPLILPLPSVGHDHADGLLRRLLIAVPPSCPVAPGIIRNALADQQVPVDGAGTVRLEATKPDAVFDAYLPKQPQRVWETVSPILISGKRARSRPPLEGDETTVAKAARDERRRHEQTAALVRRALSYSGLDPAHATFEWRREPWTARQPRADAAWRTPRNDNGIDWLANRTKFHLRLTLPEPVAGPLAIGDGRYLGLGLMAPVRDDDAPSLHLFAIDPATAPPASAAEAVAKALSRATMALVREARTAQRLRRGEPARSGEPLDKFFHGHEKNGDPARSGRHEHLFFLADDSDGDGKLDRLAILSPLLADRSPPQDEKARKAEEATTRKHLKMLARAVAGLDTLRAARAGVLKLAPAGDAEDRDALFGRARVWTSRTTYRPTRHSRKLPPGDAVREDIRMECARRGLPRPEVEIVAVETGPRGGHAARARLRFRTAVAGPILIGRGSHFGAGLFAIER